MRSSSNNEFNVSGSIINLDKKKCKEVVELLDKRHNKSCVWSAVSCPGKRFLHKTCPVLSI